MTTAPALFALHPDVYGEKIPFVVTDLIAALRKREAGKVVGIFRLNGSDVQTRELISLLDKGRVADFDQFDVHSCSTALKRYFRGIGEIHPIIPYELYACIIGIARLPSDDDAIPKLATLLPTYMPPARYKTLAYLCQYLHEISLLAESSQMNARNLSICIGPNLFVSPEAGSPNALSESLQANKELEVMIRRFDEVFPKIAADGFSAADFCTEADIAAILNKQ
jgi:hypothetical protein